MYTPSMIAAASVAAALHGLDWTRKSGYGLAGLLDELTRITAIEQVSGVRIRIITKKPVKVRRKITQFIYILFALAFDLRADPS